MKLALTFDIEFNLNHAMKPPFTRRPLGAECIESRDAAGETGLSVVLQTLDRYGLRATFFVEAMQSLWFGDREMGQVAERIARAGHEVQLHIHPVWGLFSQENWRDEALRSPPETPTHDNLAALPDASAAALLEQAIRAQARWDVPAATAIRTGGLFVERSLYRLFREHGLGTSSSVGLALHMPADEVLHHHCSPLIVDGVREFPVTTYLGVDKALRRRRRLMTLIGMGDAELRALLADARRAGVAQLVLLSHMSEFFRLGAQGVQRNRAVERRFDELCRLIAGGRGLQATTIGELAAPGPFKPGPDTPLRVPRLASSRRFLDKLRRR